MQATEEKEIRAGYNVSKMIMSTEVNWLKCIDKNIKNKIKKEKNLSPKIPGIK